MFWYSPFSFLEITYSSGTLHVVTRAFNGCDAARSVTLTGTYVGKIDSIMA
jgi:hypothetical protein